MEMPDTSLDAVFGGEAPPTPYGGPRGKGGLVPRRVNVSASSPRGPAGADPWHGSHTASWSWRAGAHPGGTVRKMERPWPEVRAFLSCSGRLFFFFRLRGRCYASQGSRCPGRVRSQEPEASCRNLSRGSMTSRLVRATMFERRRQPRGGNRSHCSLESGRGPGTGLGLYDLVIMI